MNEITEDPKSRFRRILPIAVIALAVIVTVLFGWRAVRHRRPEIPGGIAFGKVDHPDFSSGQAAVQQHVRSVRAALDQATSSNAAPGAQAQAWAELGRVYFAYEHYLPASGCFSNAVALSPNDPRTWYGLAECRFQSGEVAGAIEAMERARARFEFTTPRPTKEIGYAQRFLGDAFERQGDQAEARRRFGAVLDLEPNDLYSLIRLGRLLSQANDRAAAVQMLERARRIAPSNREVATLLSIEYRKAGRAADADALTTTLQSTDRTRKVQELQRPDPWNASARALNQSSSTIYRAGIDAMRAGQHQRAVQVFENVIRTDSNNVPARVSLGFCKLALGEPVAAGEIFLGVLNHESTDENARKGLALALAQTGRGEEAVRFCAMWQTNQPQNALPIETEAEVRVLNHDYKGAAHAYEKLIKAVPSGVTGPMGLASVQARMGLPKEALKTLETAAARLEGRSELLHVLARLRAASTDAQVRDPARALKITQSLAADTSLITLWETHALALAGNGRWTEATQLFDAALKRFGNAGAPALNRRLTRVQQALRDHVTFTEPWPFADDSPLSNVR